MHRGARSLGRRLARKEASRASLWGGQSSRASTRPAALGTLLSSRHPLPLAALTRALLLSLLALCLRLLRLLCGFLVSEERNSKVSLSQTLGPRSSLYTHSRLHLSHLPVSGTTGHPRPGLPQASLLKVSQAPQNQGSKMAFIFLVLLFNPGKVV